MLEKGLPFVCFLVLQVTVFFAIPCGASANEFDFGRPVRSLLETRSDGLFLQKWDLSCGAAALATVLKFHFGESVTERYVAEKMIRDGDASEINKRGGFSFLDLKKFAESLGYVAVGLRLPDAKSLSLHSYAIAPILEYGSQPHFVVVRSTRRTGELDIADPAFGNRTVSLSAFQQSWVGQVALVLRKRR